MSVPGNTRAVRVLRRTLRFVVRTVLLVLTVFLLLRTVFAPQGLALMAELAVARFTPYTLELQEVSGSLPRVLRIGAAHLRDEGGDFLSLERVTVMPDLGALLRGRIAVEEVSVGQATLWQRPTPQERWRLPRLPKLPFIPTVNMLIVERLLLGAPVLGVEAAFTIEGSVRSLPGRLLPDLQVNVMGLDPEGVRASVVYRFDQERPEMNVHVEDFALLPELLDMPPPLRVDLEGQGDRADWRATLQVTLASDIVAESALQFMEAEATQVESTLRIEAESLPLLRDYADIIGPTLDAHIRGGLDRHGGLTLESAGIVSETMRLDVSGNVAFESETLDMSLRLDCADLGRFPGISRAEAPIPARLLVDAAGALTRPGIVVDARIDDAPVVAGNVTLGTDETLSARGALTLLAVPPVFRLPYALPEIPVSLEFDMNYDEDSGVLTVDAFDIAMADAVVSVRGVLVPETPSCAMEADISIPDLALLSGIFELPLSGGVQLNLTASGEAARMDMQVHMAAEHPAWAGWRAEKTRMTISGQWSEWFSTAPTDLSVTAEAEVTALHRGEDGLGDWHLSATLAGPTLESCSVSDGLLSDGNIQARFGGPVNLTTLSGAPVLALEVHDLGALPLIPEVGVAGAVRVHAEGRFGLSPLTLETQVEGSLSSPGGLPEAALALLGETTAFALTASFLDGEATLRDVTLSAAGMRLSGDADYAFPPGLMHGGLRVEIPSVAPVGVALELPLSGAVEAQVGWEGVLDALDINATVEGRELAHAALPPLNLRFHLETEDALHAPSARFEGIVENGEQQLTVSGRSRYEDRAFWIEPVEVRLGDNRLSGRARFSAGQSPEMRFEAALDDLSALGALVGYSLDGVASAMATLSDGSGEVRATATDVHFGPVAVARAALDARATGVFDAPEAAITVTLSDLRAAQAIVEQLEVTCAGGLDTARVVVQMDGEVDTGLPAPQPVSVRMGGTVSAAQRAASVDSFTGAAGAFPLKLDGPVTILPLDTGFQVSPFSLSVGEGHIRFEVRYTTDEVTAKAGFDSIPLELSRLIMSPAITGRVDCEAQVSGTAAAPKAELSLRVSDARLEIDTADGFAPLTAELDLGFADNRLDMTAHALLEGSVDANATTRVPVQLTLQPFHFEMLRNEPVSGNAEVSLVFAPLIEALGMVEHHLEAALSGAFHLSGTWDQPHATGEAVIRNGLYENAITGTVLRDIQFRAEADGSSIRVVECVANTGTRGSLSARGEWRLGPGGEGPPMTAEIRFNDAHLAQLDYLNARINGAINARASLKDALISGDLEIGSVQVSMPDELPVREPPHIEVVEIHEDSEIAPPEATVPGFASAVSLDIRCRIPGRVYVRAPILDSEWGGNLHLTGSLAAPSVEGRIAVLRGHLDFLSRRFALRDSAVVFSGGPPTDPYLDMRAAAATPALSARLSLRGNMDNVVLELNSEPALPQDEILAQLLFGRNLSQISPVQAIQLARIASMFNRNLGGLNVFSGNISLPGVDRIDIRTGERSDETVVGIGRYFTDSVYVEVEQGTTSDSGKVSVEVEVSPRVSVKGDVDAQERSGVGLFWRRDY